MKPKTICLLILAAFGCLTMNATAQNEESSLSIMGGQYFDTETGTFKPNVLIRIEDGKFVHIEGNFSGKMDRIVTLGPDDYILPRARRLPCPLQYDPGSNSPRGIQRDTDHLSCQWCHRYIHCRRVHAGKDVRVTKTN